MRSNNRIPAVLRISETRRGLEGQSNSLNDLALIVSNYGPVSEWMPLLGFRVTIVAGTMHTYLAISRPLPLVPILL